VTLIQKTMAAVLMCLVSAVSFAQNTPGKVAILDLQAAVLSTEFAKKEIAALDKNPQYAAMKAKLDGLVADMKKLQTEAGRQKTSG
jgi:outer membrane protein